MSCANGRPASTPGSDAGVTSVRASESRVNLCARFRGRIDVLDEERCAVGRRGQPTDEDDANAVPQQHSKSSPGAKSGDIRPGSRRTSKCAHLDDHPGCPLEPLVGAQREQPARLHPVRVVTVHDGDLEIETARSDQPQHRVDTGGGPTRLEARDGALRRTVPVGELSLARAGSPTRLAHQVVGYPAIRRAQRFCCYSSRARSSAARARRRLVVLADQPKTSASLRLDSWCGSVARS